MRWAIPLLVTVTVLSACGSQKAAAPLPLAQRFVNAQDAPNSKPDPVEARQTTKQFDEFIGALKDNAVNPKQAEIAEAFKRGDFKSAGIDLRFYGQTHTQGKSTHVGSSFVELKSKDGANRALDWLEADHRKPCPRTCATRISTFNVDHLSHGLGVRRIATAKDIKDAGFSGERPVEEYWIGFTIGDVTYSVDLFGLPGAVSEQQIQTIARAYYDRLTRT